MLIKTKKLRVVTILFICFEIFDVITTFIGLELGLTEANPIVNKIGMGAVLLIKFLVVIIGISILQKRKYLWLDVLVLIVVILPVVWNIMQLLLVFIYW